MPVLEFTKILPALAAAPMATFWDPTFGTDFTGTGNAQITGFDATFDGIGFTATNATLQIDEIRLGTSLVDVVIPEPGRVLLLASGLLPCALRRSRRKVR